MNLTWKKAFSFLIFILAIYIIVQGIFALIYYFPKKQHNDSIEKKPIDEEQNDFKIMKKESAVYKKREFIQSKKTNAEIIEEFLENGFNDNAKKILDSIKIPNEFIDPLTENMIGIAHFLEIKHDFSITKMGFENFKKSATDIERKLLKNAMIEKIKGDGQFEENLLIKINKNFNISNVSAQALRSLAQGSNLILKNLTIEKNDQLTAKINIFLKQQGIIAPSEFYDAITGKFMKDPIKLPSSLQNIDKVTLQLLKTDPKRSGYKICPIKNKSFSMKSVVEQKDLREKIDAFLVRCGKFAAVFHDYE